ncbi:MAG TPA: hypothetical protein PKM16_04420 [Bacteroidia bacterium]|nr:hypothetical protein [Bacteroidia bacterium]
MNPSTLKDKSYIAGRCNIGDDEVKVRKKLLFISIIATMFSTSFCFIVGCSFFTLALVWLSLAFSFLLLIEIVQRFCVFFGIFNIYNFGKAGELNDVESCRCIHKDRKKAFLLILLSFIVATALTYAAYRLIENLMG